MDKIKNKRIKRGWPQEGDIMIHGLGPKFAHLGESHWKKDWTRGCIAVTDKEMEEIYAFVPVGAPIVIRP